MSSTHTPREKPPVWHPSLPIQINWTIQPEEDGSYTIWCPGNVHRWKMATVHAPSTIGGDVYARLIAAAPDLLHALVEIRKADKEALAFLRQAGIVDPEPTSKTTALWKLADDAIARTQPGREGQVEQ